jgi:hypothetical protein
MVNIIIQINVGNSRSTSGKKEIFAVLNGFTIFIPLGSFRNRRKIPSLLIDVPDQTPVVINSQ